MNRKTFLRLIGLGSLAAMIAPAVIAKTELIGIPSATPPINTGGIWDYMQKNPITLNEILTGKGRNDFSNRVLFVGPETYKRFERELAKPFGYVPHEYQFGCEYINIGGVKVFKHHFLPESTVVFPKNLK